MMNKLNDINKEHLDNLLMIGLESINHKNLFGRVFTTNDIRQITSYDGMSVNIEFKDIKTNVSVVNFVHQKSLEQNVDEYLRIIDSPRANSFPYHVHLNHDLVMFIHDGDDKSFKDAIENKIIFYNELFEICFIHESFHLSNYLDIQYLMSEFYIGYDFDKEYNPVGKLFVGNQRGLYNTIVDKYMSKFRTYRDGFNVQDESILLKHYILMDSLERFDEIFTQFYGPLPKPLDMELVRDQLKLANMVLFDK